MGGGRLGPGVAFWLGSRYWCLRARCAGGGLGLGLPGLRWCVGGPAVWLDSGPSVPVSWGVCQGAVALGGFPPFSVWLVSFLAFLLIIVVR